MPISEKLAKVIALWRGAATEGERQAARARGEALAAKAGLTFDQAAKEQIAATSGGNPFAGFDDWMEAKEPGYKAQQAKMRAEREQARRARCAALVERYGSEEAALAPCERERILLDAVAKWRKPRDAPYERWTDSLDGWCSDYAAAPPHVAEAIRNSYPFPQTFAAAQAELDYWRQRDRDMRDILDSDYGLDLVADCRSRMVEKAIESDLEVNSAADLLARFRLYRKREYHDYKTETGIFEDLERLAAIEAARDLSASVHIEAADPSAPICPTRNGQIEAALLADASRSDRSIARQLGCSPTTVGKVRVALGLAGVARSVHRRGQIYAASFRG